MKSVFIVVFASTLLCIQPKAQLKPFIGLNQLPQANDLICPIPNYLGSFTDSGYHKGDTVHDFNLYNKDSEPWRLSEFLKTGKPVLLISSSYTCPIFRGKIPIINELQRLYKDQLEIIVFYTVEAHPDKDISPYFGKVNTGAVNQKDGILYRQPIIYADRLKIVEDLLNAYNLEVPVFIDGPCNEWWLHFGPAPNNATLIDATGIVRIKHAWFDREPDNILCELKKYFDPLNSCDSIPNDVGEFSFMMSTDTLIKGEVNSTMYVSGIIQNTSNVPVSIDVKRLVNNMPVDWSSSICLDVCYPTSVDSTRITLRAKEKMNLIVDFFTASLAAKGSVRLGMRNVNNTLNRAFMNATAITEEIVVSNDNAYTEEYLRIYPNPVSSHFIINANQFDSYRLYDAKGVLVQIGSLTSVTRIEKCNLTSGIYIIQVTSSGGTIFYRKLLFL